MALRGRVHEREIRVKMVLLKRSWTARLPARTPLKTASMGNAFRQREGTPPLPPKARHLRFWWIVLLVATGSVCCQGQAALLMEQPYGLPRILSPIGHVAIYFARICPETPTRMRRCGPGELGAVIARYDGIGEYDWVATPLLPYLYAVENADEVPARADRTMVSKLRRQYHDKYLMVLGTNLAEGRPMRRGWDQLAGGAYDRRIYALRFSTTPDDDDRMIAWLNTAPNRSRFHLLWSNCADFASLILNFYFPGVFHRRILPDAGITTPRQLAYQLQQYAMKHRELDLGMFEIPQVPGSRRRSLGNKSAVESFIVGGYVVPVAVFAPWVAAGIGADFLIWGRYPLDLKSAQVLRPGELDRLNTEPMQARRKNSD